MMKAPCLEKSAGMVQQEGGNRVDCRENVGAVRPKGKHKEKKMAEPQVFPRAQVQPGFKQATAVPTRKVAASGIAGTVVTLVVWVLNTYVLKTPIPGDIAATLTTVFAFALSYYVPPAPSDQPVQA
jgi:hypothetical protein